MERHIRHSGKLGTHTRPYKLSSGCYHIDCSPFMFLLVLCISVFEFYFQAKLLRQIVLSGMVDQVARKADIPEQEQTSKKRPLYHTVLLEEMVQIHNSSVLYREYPEWIVYQEIYETNKVYLRGNFRF